jgi:hypothetical protein
MMIRHTKLVVASTLTVLLTACSAQSGNDRKGVASTSAAAPAGQPVPATDRTETQTPVAVSAPAEVSAEAPPGAGPAVAETTAPVNAAAPATAPAATGALEAVPATPSAGGPSAPQPAAAREPAHHEVTLPAGTSLPIDLRTTVASDTSHVEDRVTAALRQPVAVRGVEVLPTGTRLLGHVTAADRSARVKGRARVGFRFTSLDLPGDGGQTPIRTSSVVRLAPATKKEDAMKIGGGAAGGAVIGAILGGGGGAAKGAAIGGAGGTGVVLATRGHEVRVPAGTNLIVRLESPITVRVRR